MKVFYIGEMFYRESNTIMSSIYTKDKIRTDWGQIELALMNGEKVSISPASKQEMVWAHNVLIKLKRDKRR